MKIETYPKKKKLVDMVLYDGTEESAYFIAEWSEGALDVQPRTSALIFMSQDSWVTVRPDHYIVKGSDTDFYPMPVADAHLYYDIPNAS